MSPNNGVDLHAGDDINERIRLVRPLGQGAMGTVSVAEHLALHIEVAVKVISPEHAQRAELTARFQK